MLPVLIPQSVNPQLTIDQYLVVQNIIQEMFDHIDRWHLQNVTNTKIPSKYKQNKADTKNFKANTKNYKANKKYIEQTQSITTRQFYRLVLDYISNSWNIIKITDIQCNITLFLKIAWSSLIFCYRANFYIQPVPSSLCQHYQIDFSNSTRSKCIYGF